MALQGDASPYLYRLDLLGASTGSCRHDFVGQGYGPDLRKVVVHPTDA